MRAQLRHLLVGVLLFLAVGAAVALSRDVSEAAPLRRQRGRVAVTTAAGFVWPALVLGLMGTEPFCYPASVSVVVGVALCLSFEVAALSLYSGPLSAYENSDAMYERAVQVSTVAFAVATLMLSQTNKRLAAVATVPVLLACLLCTGATVPSAVARRRVGSAMHWNALCKMAVSFAAGLLCLAVARCLDALQVSGQLQVSVAT